MQDAFAYCAQRLREEDKDHFLSALFAPEAQRPALHAIYAFDLEVAGIGGRVHEPMAGEIRLQWWRDVLSGERSGEATANPIAAALLETIERYTLPCKTLTNCSKRAVLTSMPIRWFRSPNSKDMRCAPRGA